MLSPKRARAARERQAELATIRLHPTRLSGFGRASPSREYGDSQQQNTESPRLLEEPQNEANEREGLGDLFDTDLEGVDDSTITISVLRETEVGSVTGKPFPTREDTNHPDADLTQKDGGYKSIADRIKELDSGDEEDGDIDTEYREGPARPTDVAERIEDNMNHIQDEEQNSNRQVANEPPTREILSWQKIEAILREDDSRPTNGTGGEIIHYPQNQDQNPYISPETYPKRAAAAGLGEQKSYLEAPKLAPRPIAQRLSTRNRFAARPHFAAPDPYSSHAVGANNTVENLEDGSDAGQQQLQLPKEDQYPAYNRAAFDAATDLSTLDCSDDDGFEEVAGLEEAGTFQSPHLSTVSAASSKRPLSNFISDYPPNILESKSFSDLQAESFDYNPTPMQPIFPHDAPLALEDKLSRVKNLTEDQRRVFFSSVTLSEWEECGDWLIEQFCIMLRKSKEARRVRREVAAIFEAEVKRRHDSVECEGSSIKNRLEDMRAGGMGVLKGQTP
ncbi:uncharacterized protein GIQ15_06173 [Arthroderma uncinatum]|uniref:uncharacterized protein n=1 Tax=Arthroderma uncinatum TaxID=74035 RepID=UPI00144A8BA1|nr:uncharacterized protein GIQ15_06173 [Arthroderma uncinatum]KAF3480826.1 hypothetical protein GIQ15_06173 [Arthroderma uncinatum]